MKRIVIMEPFIIDKSDTAYFKGMTVCFPYIKEGLAYAKANGISRILVRGESDKKITVNMDFFRDCDFITVLHWLVPLSQRSDISGLYSLVNLRELRWTPIKLDIDLSRLVELEELTIRYSSDINGWKCLSNLKKLFLTKVDTEDLTFLEGLANLSYLRILRGSLSSIHGLEKCDKLEVLFLQCCGNITTLLPTLNELRSIERVNIESCRNLAKDERYLKLKHFSML